MQDVVSRWIDVVVFVALLAVAGGIVLPAFPWSSLVFAAMTASLVLWMTQRSPVRSTAQLTWDALAEAPPPARDARRF